MAKSKAGYWLTSDGLTLLKGWARDGLTDEQIAHNCKISRSTLGDWKRKYPVISDTLKKEKTIVDYEVENALFKRAMGYSYVEETHELVLDKETNQYIERCTKKVTKQVAPDPTSMIYWLKNRQPQKWREKPQEPQKDDEGVVILDDLPKTKSNKTK